MCMWVCVCMIHLRMLHNMELFIGLSHLQVDRSHETLHLTRAGQINCSTFVHNCSQLLFCSSIRVCVCVYVCVCVQLSTF